MYVHLSVQCWISAMSHTQAFITVGILETRLNALISMLRYLRHET